MTLDPTKQLGEMLGRMSRSQQTTDENLTPEESESQLQLLNDEYIEMVGSATFTANLYGSTSFILDHPVYGELDSSILELDGGYQANFIAYSAGAFSYPGTYAGGTSTLYTTTF